MKNKLLVLMSLILCLSMLFVLASCGGNEDTDTDTDTKTETNSETNNESTDSDTPKESDTESEDEEPSDDSDSDEATECEHANYDLVPIIDVTCTQNGVSNKVCSECEEVLGQEEIIAEGHKMGKGQQTQELTCTQDGIETKKCDNCEETETKTTTAEGHKVGDWETVSELTCTENGVKVKKCTVCQEEAEREETPALGHNWTEWGIGWDGDPFKKDATCTEKGWEGRVCYGDFCGIEETRETNELPHTLGAWIVPEGVTCTTGGTVTRECENCDYTEEQIVEAGGHVNVVYEGAVEATKEAYGSTGVKKCLACNTIIEEAKVIRIVNVASNATASIPNTGFWAANNSDIQKIIDGNKETGVYSYPDLLNMTDRITLETTTDIFEVVLVVNSKGNIAQGPSYSEVTNKDYKIYFSVYDENGEAIFRSADYTTLDQTEIVVSVALPEGKTAKEIRVTRVVTDYGASEAFLWEVEIYSKQYLSSCEANGHSWSEWAGTEPSCSQDALTDGVKTRTCSVCGQEETEVTKAEHAWTEWDTENFSCITGGTMTRECQSCGKQDSQTTEGGEHGELEVQGAKAPTLEEEGYTGDKVCTVCGETTETGTVIAKLVNYALSGTGSTSQTHTTVISSPDTRPFLNDGDLNTGMTSHGNYRDVEYIVSWESAVDVNHVIVYFNGDATDKNLGQGGYNASQANSSAQMSLTVYGADGTTVIKTESFSATDLTSYEFIFEEAVSISKIVVKATTSWNLNNCALNVWEIMAIGDGEAVTTEE